MTTWRMCCNHSVAREGRRRRERGCGTRDYSEGKWIEDHREAHDFGDWAEVPAIARTAVANEMELVLHSDGFNDVSVRLSALTRLQALFS